MADYIPLCPASATSFADCRLVEASKVSDLNGLTVDDVVYVLPSIVDCLSLVMVVAVIIRLLKKAAR